MTMISEEDLLVFHLNLHSGKKPTFKVSVVKIEEPKEFVIDFPNEEKKEDKKKEGKAEKKEKSP